MCQQGRQDEERRSLLIRRSASRVLGVDERFSTVLSTLWAPSTACNVLAQWSLSARFLVFWRRVDTVSNKPVLIHPIRRNIYACI